MDSIHIPTRYLSADPADMWGEVTSKEKRSMNCHVYIALLGIRFRNGKAVRSRRIESSFMQVYSVQFLNRSQAELDVICGTIVVGSDKIFDRQESTGTPHDIDPKGFARLTGPSVPIDVEDCNIGFFPMLFRKKKTGDFYHPNNGVQFSMRRHLLRQVESVPTLDKPGICGKYLSIDRVVKKFGKLLYEEVETTCGIVGVNYAMFEDAADSFLVVRLLEWHGEGDAANVYGRIRTSDTLLSDNHNADKTKSVAFDVSRNNPMSVKPGQYISLHRPGTVVPMGHSLEVEVEIFHTNNNNDNMGCSGEQNGDKLIARKTCYFEARSLPEGSSLSVCNEDEDDDDDNESMESDDSSSEDEDHKPAVDVQFDGINESRIIRGDWGTIELRVYWMPCWNRCFLAEDDEVSMKTLH